MFSSMSLNCRSFFSIPKTYQLSSGVLLILTYRISKVLLYLTFKDINFYILNIYKFKPIFPTFCSTFYILSCLCLSNPCSYQPADLRRWPLYHHCVMAGAQCPSDRVPCGRHPQEHQQPHERDERGPCHHTRRCSRPHGKPKVLVPCLE